MTNEDIFIKNKNEEEYEPMVEDEKPKKKRQLTQKQLDALERGRKKAAERREAKKKEAQETKKTKKIVKESKEAEKVNNKQIKEQKQVKRQNLKKQKALQQVIKREEEEKKLNHFETLKYEALSKVNNVNTFRQLDDRLSQLSREEILNTQSLVNTLKGIAKDFEINQSKQDREDVDSQNKI